jgi:hypothetical protein
MNHWAMAGTGLRNGDLFGEKTLHERVPGGASGHETDKVSTNSPKTVQRFAKGTNPDDGGADLVCHEVERGAVFSVGSITWVSALFTDPHVSRITRNVLERFLQKSTDEPCLRETLAKAPAQLPDIFSGDLSAQLFSEDLSFQLQPSKPGRQPLEPFAPSSDGSVIDRNDLR